MTRARRRQWYALSAGVELTILPPLYPHNLVPVPVAGDEDDSTPPPPREGSPASLGAEGGGAFPDEVSG